MSESRVRGAGGDGLTDDALVDAIRGDGWPSSPLREGGVTAERHRRALELVASTDDPLEAWAALGDVRPAGGPSDAGRWFHLRRGSLVPVRRPVVRRMRETAVRIALCPSPGVPKAPCIAHPVSVAEAVTFGTLGPLLRDVEARARAAANAFDAIGRPTHALAAAAKTAKAAGARAIVWRTRDDRARAGASRAAVSLAVKVLEQHGGGRAFGARLERVGDAMPACHHSEWSRTRVAAVGALAWRAAVERGLRVAPSGAACGPRFFVTPEVVGRAYEELVDPFALLCVLGVLGVEVVAFSPEAITLEVCQGYGVPSLWVNRPVAPSRCMSTSG